MMTDDAAIEVRWQKDWDHM